MKNAFYFILKVLFVLKIFKFLFWLFGQVEKTAFQKDEVNFKIYDVKIWLRKNYNTHIALMSRSENNQTMKFGKIIECKKKNIFLQNSCRKWGRETSPRPLFVFFKNTLSMT